MQIRINVRSASRRNSAITQRLCEYPDRSMTVEEFLAETVRQNVREYNERKGATDLLRLFLRNQSDDPLEEKLVDSAATGKVSYGELMSDQMADADKAVRNALQCFDDGIVVLFADGKRYADRHERIPLRDQSEVTFVRLVFLAGRMW